MLEGNTKGAILVVTYERWHTTTYIGVVRKPLGQIYQMIEENKFIDYVTRTFNFLQTEFQFRLGKRMANGNVFYDVEYTDDKTKIISISFETIENFLQVTLFTMDNGMRSDYDDSSKTFHLNQLNEQILSTLDKDEFEQNNEYFKNLETKNEIEKTILKSAKDLRLCLKHIND